MRAQHSENGILFLAALQAKSASEEGAHIRRRRFGRSVEGGDGGLLRGGAGFGVWAPHTHADGTLRTLGGSEKATESNPQLHKTAQRVHDVFSE